MKTVIINKSNWSGEEAEIKLYADGKTLKIPEYDVKVRIKGKRIRDKEFDLDFTDFKVEEFIESKKEWIETDWKGTTDHKTNETMVGTWNWELTRDTKKDPRIAVAQVIFNVY